MIYNAAECNAINKKCHQCHHRELAGQPKTMSNTQNHTTIQQRQRQQRQILAMMGIEQWIRTESPTLEMASITIYAEPMPPTVQQPASSECDRHHMTHLHGRTGSANDVYTDTAPIPDNFVRVIDKYVNNNHIIQASAPIAEQVSTIETGTNSLDDTSPDKIAAFDLQGGRYQDWVLMVDIQALNHDSQKLWQNMLQALSLDCETASFPICAGMDTAELANASLAGYVFRVGRREDIKVAALTILPEGLSHPNLIPVPTLDALLADSRLKRQLWQQLSGSQ